MAPVVGNNQSPGGSGRAADTNLVSATEADSQESSSAAKTQQRKTAKGAVRKPKCSSKKRTGQAGKRQKMSGKKADQAYKRMMTTRKLFEDSKPGETSSKVPTGDTEYSGNVQKYFDSNPDVEDEVMKAERGMIDDTHHRCRGKVDTALCRDGLYSIRGGTTPLTPIQFATLGWMMKREAVRTKQGAQRSTRGGIVAHTMGLGKTLMALSLMVVNGTGRPKRLAECSTLVVVPNNAIIEHWEEECVKHASGVFMKESMARYGALKSVRRADAFREYDIVFATYGELGTDIPDFYKEAKDPEKPLDPEVLEKIENHRWAAIFEANWFRVILDEAHSIKNKDTKASLAVRRLQTNRAWMITGTPLSNSKDEMFPYFNFLGVEDSEYNSTFTKTYFPKGKAIPAFRGVLADVMIRRQIGETFLGQEIISLPSHHALTKIILPSAKEKVILEFLVTKIRDTAAETYQEALKSTGTVNAACLQAYASVRTLLHFYRYASIHPFMLENAIMSVFSVEDVKRLLGELEKAEGQAGESEKTNDSNFRPIQEIVRIGLKHRDLSGKVCAKCKQDCDVIPGVVYTIPCGHFLCFGCVSNGPALPPGIQRRQRCADKGCSRKFTYPSDIECPPSLYHPMFLSEDSSDSDSDSEDERPMPAKAPRKGRGRGKQPTMESWPTRSPGSDQHGNMPPLDNNKRRFLDFADTYLKKSKMVVPSAKIEGVQKLIREWQETAPDDKIIIFTQFMVVANLLGRIAYLEKKKFLYYTGDMSANARKLALAKFRTDNSVKILITSLKCGGQGIDITSANRVILMELWWNSSAEDQAFSRSYRMGQNKEVHVVRFICSGTKEDDIAELQRKKDTELSDCLMSKKATTTKHSLLSVLTLMGLPIEDEDGAVTGFRKADEEEEEEEAVFTSDEEGYEKSEVGMDDAEEGDKWEDEAEESEGRGKEKESRGPTGEDEGVNIVPNGSEENSGKDDKGGDPMGQGKKAEQKIGERGNSVDEIEKKSKDGGGETQEAGTEKAASVNQKEHCGGVDKVEKKSMDAHAETQGAGTGEGAGINQGEQCAEDDGVSREKVGKIDERSENIAQCEERETESQQKGNEEGKDGEKQGEMGREDDEKDEDGDTVMG